MIQHRPLAPTPPNAGGPHWFAPAGLPPTPNLAPAGLHLHPGQPVPEVRIRPRLVWVGLAWLLFGVLVLTGVGTFVSASTGTGPNRFFAAGEVATIELDPDAGPLIYAALDAGGSVRCGPVGPRAHLLTLTPVTTDRSVVVDGREWHAAFDLTPAAAGTYQVVCDGRGASFAAGDRLGTATGGATVALLALPLVGLAAAVITTAVVLLKRRAEQERLFAPWTGGTAAPGQWSPGQRSPGQWR